MNDRDVQFIQRRRWLAASWNLIGTVMVLLLAGTLVYAFVRAPLLVNPWHVGQTIQGHHLDRRMAELMAAMLPIVMLACFTVLAAVVGFSFAAFANERRYLAIIDALQREQTTGDGRQ